MGTQTERASTQTVDMPHTLNQPWTPVQEPWTRASQEPWTRPSEGHPDEKGLSAEVKSSSPEEARAWARSGIHLQGPTEWLSRAEKARRAEQSGRHLEIARATRANVSAHSRSAVDADWRDGSAKLGYDSQQVANQPQAQVDDVKHSIQYGMHGKGGEAAGMQQLTSGYHPQSFPSANPNGSISDYDLSTPPGEYLRPENLEKNNAASLARRRAKPWWDFLPSFPPIVAGSDDRQHLDPKAATGRATLGLTTLAPATQGLPMHLTASGFIGYLHGMFPNVSIDINDVIEIESPDDGSRAQIPLGQVIIMSPMEDMAHYPQRYPVALVDALERYRRRTPADIRIAAAHANEPNIITRNFFPTHLAGDEYEKWLKSIWGAELGKSPIIAVSQADAQNPKASWVEDLPLGRALEMGERFQLIPKSSYSKGLIEAISAYRSSTDAGRSESRQKYEQSIAEAEARLKRFQEMQEKLQNTTVALARQEAEGWSRNQSWAINLGVNNVDQVDAYTFLSNLDSHALSGTFSLERSKATISQSRMMKIIDPLATRERESFMSGFRERLAEMDKIDLDEHLDSRRQRFEDRMISRHGATALNADLVLDRDLEARLAQSGVDAGPDTRANMTVHTTAWGNEDWIRTMHVNLTLRELHRGQWRKTALSQLGLGYHLVAPIAHWTPEVVSAELENGVELTSGQLAAISDHLDMTPVISNAVAFVGQPALRQAMERDRTRQYVRACDKLIFDIEHGQIESFPQDPAFKSTLRILRNVRNGQSEYMFSLVSKSRAGSLPVNGVVAVQLGDERWNALFLDGTYMIVTTDELSQLGKGVMHASPRLRGLLSKHIDLKQRIEATIPRSVFSDYMDAYERRSGDGYMYGHVSFDRFSGYSKRSRKLANLVRRSWTRLCREFPDAVREAGLHEQDIFKDRAAFKRASKVFSQQYPDENIDVRMTIEKIPATNTSLAELVHKQTPYDVVRLKRDMDAKRFGANRLSQEQWHETVWFAVTTALSAGVGVGAGLTAQALHMSSKAAWLLGIAADLLAGGAMDYADFELETNEQEREGKATGILLGALMSLGFDLGAAGVKKLWKFAKSKGFTSTANGDIPTQQLARWLSVEMPEVIDQAIHWSSLGDSQRTDWVLGHVMETDAVQNLVLNAGDRVLVRSQIEAHVRASIEKSRGKTGSSSFVDEFVAGYAAANSIPPLQKSLSDTDLEKKYSILKQRYITDSKWKEEFEAGRNEFETIDIPGIDRSAPTPSATKMQRHFIDGEMLTTRQKGALSVYIDEASKREGLFGVRKKTEIILNDWDRVGKGKAIALPQDFLLPLMEAPSQGRCLPLVRAMTVALEHGNEANLALNLFEAAAKPHLPESKRLVSALHTLHDMQLGSASNKFHGEWGISEIVKKLKETQPSDIARGRYFEIDTMRHSMLVGAVKTNGVMSYIFFDPNFGLGKFPTPKALRKVLMQHLRRRRLAEFYSAFGDESNPKFRITELYPKDMKDLRIGTGPTIGELSKSDAPPVASPSVDFDDPVRWRRMQEAREKKLNKMTSRICKRSVGAKCDVDADVDADVDVDVDVEVEVEVEVKDNFNKNADLHIASMRRPESYIKDVRKKNKNMNRNKNKNKNKNDDKNDDRNRNKNKNNIGGNVAEENYEKLVAEFSDMLSKRNVKVLISLDGEMHYDKKTDEWSRQLGRNGIEFISDEKYFINDFFTKGNNGLLGPAAPTAEQIKDTVNLIKAKKKKYPGSLIAVHCGAGDGRSGMVKSAVAMEDLYNNRRRGVYQNDRKGAVDVMTKYEKYPEEYQPAYRLVDDGVKEIRKTHGHAVERSEDVEVLNEYAKLLISS
ncbi:hypothetical protein [Burkholderia stagnalis]|uniref:hypothetical protein n=1 Tax=Burkholderia stagnalis TaxID=1503054 RepID=UPI000F5908A4|nr:hypothetical protein [Burkholderia stagnalis]